MSSEDENDSMCDSRPATPDISTTSTCTGTSFSELGDASIVSRKQKQAALKWAKKEQKKAKEKEKKKLRNKISKDDFYAKITEFKFWLQESKKMQFEHMEPKQHKEYFKKFIKKWNGKKLDKKFYRGVDCLWALGTPDTQVNWAMPGTMEVTPGSLPEEKLTERYSRPPATGLGTFGKKAGAQMLREMRNRKNSKHEPVMSMAPHIGSMPATMMGLFLPPAAKTQPTENSPSKVGEEEEWPAPPPPCTNIISPTVFDDTATVLKMMEDCTQGHDRTLSGTSARSTSDLPLPPPPDVIPSPRRRHQSQPIRASIPIPPEPIRASIPIPSEPIRAPNPIPPEPIRAHNPIPSEPIRDSNPIPPEPIRTCNPIPPEPIRTSNPIPPEPIRAHNLIPSEPIRAPNPIPSEPIRASNPIPPEPIRAPPPPPPKPKPDLKPRPQSYCGTSSVKFDLVQLNPRPQSSSDATPSKATSVSDLASDKNGSCETKPAPPTRTTSLEKLTKSDHSIETKTSQAEKPVPPARSTSLEKLGAPISKDDEKENMNQEALDQVGPLPAKVSKTDSGQIIPRSMPAQSYDGKRKVARQDSYCSQLSSASLAVFQTLSATKGSKKPGELTPVRLKSNNSFVSTPTGSPHKLCSTTSAGTTSAEGFLQLTPGSSSHVTRL